MKKDIQNRPDIELLVNTFYEKAREDKVLGYIFDNVAKTDWESHLPKMYSFWASILLGEYCISRNNMQNTLHYKNNRNGR